MNDPNDKTAAAYSIPVPFSPERKLVIDFSLTRFQRTRHTDDSIEAEIDALWESRKIDNPSLFDAGKFRLAYLTLTRERLILHVGLTDYKTYIGTHGKPHALSKLSRECMAQPLGNATVIQTLDGFTPVLVRSGTAADIPGGISFPGGHAEPDDVLPRLQELDSRVALILAQGARTEVLEETFASEDDVPPAQSFVFLGLVERTVDAKATMIYFTTINLTAEQLAQKYRDGNTSGTESVSMKLLASHELESMRDSRCYTPVAELLGGLDLWKAMNAKSTLTR